MHGVSAFAGARTDVLPARVRASTSSPRTCPGPGRCRCPTGAARSSNRAKPPVPPTGPADGETKVDLYGTNLQFIETVTFNGVPASNVQRLKPTHVSCVNPPGAGAVPVIAIDDQGVQTNSEVFIYQPPPA
jgi:hypothetical protein